MIVPCEVAVKCLLPSVRAIIAKILMTKHNFKQVEAAKLLGVSQPAISLYYRKIRGRAIDLEEDMELLELVARTADLLAEGKLSHKDFISMFCSICRKVRSKGLLCQLHKNFDPNFDIENCELCMSTDSLRCI